MASIEELVAELNGQLAAMALPSTEGPKHFVLKIGRDKNGWFYALFDDPRQTSTVPMSIEELLALEQQDTVLTSVHLSDDPTYGFELTRCSREDLVEKLAPFIAARTQPSTSLWVNGHREVILAAVDMFRAPFAFGDLFIGYEGQESDDFLVTQLQNNPGIRHLRLMSPWPQSEALEDVLFKHLTSGVLEVFSMERLQRHDRSSMRFTYGMFRQVFGAWSSAETDKAFKFEGPGGGLSGVTVEDVLSMPYPEEMARVEDNMTSFFVNMIVVAWTKPNGWHLEFRLNCSDDDVTLSSSGCPRRLPTACPQFSWFF
uniref:Tudor domain-containing protein n=1 Tax=Steinernema glaseri TaxID=37863 RepID=A0A1I7Y255_9BILA